MMQEVFLVVQGLLIMTTVFSFIQHSSIIFSEIRLK